MQVKWLQEHFNTKIAWFNYLWLAIIFAVNFLGHPALKFVFLGYSLFIFLSILFFEPQETIQLIVSYSFIEGQGKILWGYHPLSRIAFDLVIVIATLRGFIVSRNIKIAHYLPRPMIIFIALHFAWFIVEVFNLNGINSLAALATTKIYVFPFFLLIFFRQNEEAFNLKNIERLSNLVLFLLLMECALGLYQQYHSDPFLIGISSNYVAAMKGVFTGIFFRPFGTTMLPGNISILIYLTGSLIFIRKSFSKKLTITLVPVYALFFLLFIVCQIRSALMKFAVILTGVCISLFMNTKNRLAATLRILSFLLIVTPILGYIFYPQIQAYSEKYLNLESGLNRWEGLDSIEDLGQHRITPTRALEFTVSKLKEFPMGLGPGVTGAASSLVVEQVANDPIYTKAKLWVFDNFYLSLVLEFGYGAIFYLCYLFYVPIILFYFYRTLYTKGDLVGARIVSISLINIIVIMIGNWGAIGLPYNPESFYIWLWAAIGFNTYHLAIKEKSALELEGNYVPA